MKNKFLQQRKHLLLAALILGSALNAFAQRGGGGFGGGGFGGGGGFNPLQALIQGAGGRGGGNNAGPVAPRVMAVADERSNSLIVTAPDEIMKLIEDVIRLVDVNVDDVTVLKVFKLQNANPVDVATQLATLYPDPTQNTGFGRGGNRGGGRGFGAQTQGSERIKRLGRVMSVADPRTSSIIITASKELMDEIERMIADLDKDVSHRKQVYVFDLENADPIQVEQALRVMFESQNASSRNQSLRNQNNTGTALQNRQQGATRGQGATRNVTGSQNRGTGSSFTGQ